MASTHTPETDRHKDAVINPADTRTLPHTYTKDQADAVHSVIAAEQAKTSQISGKNLAPLELTGSEKAGSSHAVHIEEKRNGKVVGSDDVYTDGSRVHTQTDSHGVTTQTQTDKSGKFVHSETDDKSGHKTSETQQHKNGRVTQNYDEHGKVTSTVTELPNGKIVESTDKNGNVTKSEIDGSGKQFHSETHDSSGKLTREEFDSDGKKTVKTVNKDGTQTESTYGSNGKLTEENQYDKNHRLTSTDEVESNGSRYRSHFDANGKVNATDWMDKSGQPIRHDEFDDKGRSTRVISYDKGKKSDETVTNYDDKTGSRTETHKLNGGSQEVKIFDKQGNYKEYDYDKNHQQKLYGEGDEKDGLKFSTDLSSDAKWKPRQFSDQN